LLHGQRKEQIGKAAQTADPVTDLHDSKYKPDRSRLSGDLAAGIAPVALGMPEVTGHTTRLPALLS
jgi:hypothetical protein